MKSLYRNPPPKPLAFIGVAIAIGLVSMMFIRFQDRSILINLILSGLVVGIAGYNLWAAYQPPAGPKGTSGYSEP